MQQRVVLKSSKAKQRRFSDQLLFAVRNHIPIKLVIDELLRVPSKISQGTYRFRCPICGEYNTAVNRQTNLARCFTCEKNFNPIDMVMTVEGINFVETVNSLKSFKETKTHQTSDLAPCLPNKKTPSTSQTSSENPTPIGDVLAQHLEKLQTVSILPVTSDPSYQKHIDFEKIEQDVLLLSQQIEKLKTLIHTLQSKRQT